MLSHVADIQELNLSLKEFIASPKSVDIISDAVAVCAPWSALSRYKYKVKLTPGTTKKGKAARSIVEGFLAIPMDENGEDAEKMHPREKEMLASLKGKWSSISFLTLQMRILFSAFGRRVLKLEEKRNQAKEERKYLLPKERERNDVLTGPIFSLCTWDSKASAGFLFQCTPR